MIRVGIIGCGGIGKTHAKAYSNIEGVKICAFVDKDIKRAEVCTQEFGGKAYESLDSMFNDGDNKLDLVSVVTPPGTHYSILLELLKRKVPVFCEKPLTMNVKEAKEVVKLSIEAGLQLGIGFKMRYEPVFAKARELISQIGEIYAVSAVKNQPYNPVPGREWIKDTGCMYELSVHEYDLINWIGNFRPKKVYAELDYSMGWRKENRAYLFVEYNDGIKGQLMSIYSPNTVFTGRDLVLTFVGESGYMRVERPDRIILHTKEYKVINIEPISNLMVFTEQFREFINCLKNGLQYKPDVYDGTITTFMVEAANKSYAESRKIMIDEM